MERLLFQPGGHLVRALVGNLSRGVLISQSWVLTVALVEKNSLMDIIVGQTLMTGLQDKIIIISELKCIVEILRLQRVLLAMLARLMVDWFLMNNIRADQCV